MTTETKLIQRHVRMNDYVGAGIYATVSWDKPCTTGDSHFLGLLTHTCSRCGAEPTTIEYETE